MEDQIRLATHQKLDKMTVNQLQRLGAHSKLEKVMHSHHILDCMVRARLHDIYLFETYKNEPRKLIAELNKFHGLRHRMGFWFKILICEHCDFQFDAFEQIDARINAIIAEVDSKEF